MTVVTVRGDLQEARRPEVGDLQQASVGDEDVRRAQVAVQDALAMRVVHGVADLTRVVHGARQVERALARDDGLERLAGHELHHDEEHVLLLLRGEDRDDVRVIEAGEEPRLAQEFAEIDALLVRNLQRNFLVNPRVFGEVHGAEPAAADRLEDFVLPDDLSAEEHWRRV